MPLVSIVAKRDKGKIDRESATHQVVGEVPDDPYYWEPICAALLPELIKAGIVPPLEKKTDKNHQVG